MERDLEAIRKLVEESTLSQLAIGRQVGVSTPVINRLIQKHGWRRPKGAPRTFKRVNPPQKARSRPQLLGQIVEKQLAQIDAILARMGGAAATQAGERQARMLASLVKTLGELRRLDEEGAAAAAGEDAHEEPIDAFRERLAKRIEALCPPAADRGGAGRARPAGDPPAG